MLRFLCQPRSLQHQLQWVTILLAFIMAALLGTIHHICSTAMDATITTLNPIYVDIQQSSTQLLALRKAIAAGGAMPHEAAVRLMKLKDPIGKTFGYHNADYQIIGVVKDLLRESPYLPVSPSFFVLGKNNFPVMPIRLGSRLSTTEALATIATVFKTVNPGSPFTYTFVDRDFGRKFDNEQRIGRLAALFAALAIFISCLGLFGLISFVAEQRTREIGLRKVLGATVLDVWGLLSREFILLVGISLCIATPVAWYAMHKWLEGYTYHTPLSWWVFVAAGAGAMAITLLTISVQAIKAALVPPVKSLRKE